MATPPERYDEWMKWMLPSLNVDELAGLFSGMRTVAPQPVLEEIKQLAKKNLDQKTWNTINERAKPLSTLVVI